MLTSYTAKYTKIDSGYMGQLVEWPEVITEGEDIEKCRNMLRDALNEMILAYQQQDKEIPPGIRNFPDLLAAFRVPRQTFLLSVSPEKGIWAFAEDFKVEHIRNWQLR